MVGQVVDTASGPGHGPVAIAVAIELLVIALAMTFLVRICLGGVLVGADDVIVRNPLRSHRLPWTDIAQFEISDDPPYPQLARAALRNGSSLEIAGIRSGREGDGGDLVSGLNELLAERS